MEYKNITKLVPFETFPSPNGCFELKQLLGTGTCGKVYSAIDLKSGQRVAVKVLEHLAENLLEIEAEFRFLTAFGGEFNIPAFYGAYMKEANDDRPQQLWLVMELCEGTMVSDLLTRLRRNGQRLKEDQIALILKSLMESIQYLHQNGVIHRDVRSGNMMLSSEGGVKLIDFGFCSLMEEENRGAQSAIGAPYWMSPEVITCEQISLPYDKSCDIWSIGITAIELTDNLPPLADVHPVRALFKIVRNPPPTVRKPEACSDQLKDFISECLVKTPDHRPVIQELLQHPFIVRVGGKEEKIRSELGQWVRKNPLPLDPDHPPTVTVKNGYLKTDASSMYEKMYTDDLGNLENPSVESVVDHLFHRYERGDIYTYAGDILLAITPYQDVQPLNKDSVCARYKEKTRSDNPPHVFAVADRAYQQMLHHKLSQSILLMGASGSGKSFSTLKIVNHLVYLGASPTEGINQKILHICPLLDSFGNAKTEANDNGSRFIKSVEVTFTKTGKATGAILWTSLLEKTRVTSTPPKESNFFIFYYLYGGLKAAKRLSEFSLEKEVTFRYLPVLDSFSSASLIEGFYTIQGALGALAFTDEEIKTILCILAAILLLGNLDFIDKSGFTDVSNEDVLSAAAKQLAVDKNSLKASLCSEKDAEKAKEERNTFCRLLYSRVFDWVISMANRQLSFSRMVLGDTYSITVLDPPGFEDGTENDLSRLCSNTISDYLHNYIHKLMFYKELEEYKEENVQVPFKYEDTTDHTNIIRSLLDGHKGLLTALYRSSLVAARSDTGWTEELQNATKPGYVDVEGNCVSVSHIYGQVRYSGRELTYKNMEKVTANAIITLVASADPRIVAVAKGNPSSPIRNSPRKSLNKLENFSTRETIAITQQLQNVLPNLLEIATDDFPHVIMCLRPTWFGKPGAFDAEAVSHQVRCLNILETILIRQKGYARRLSFMEFLKRYKFLAFEFNENVEMTKDNCRLLLIRLNMDGWVLGQNKVFLKYHSEEYLSHIYETHIKKIVKIQALARRFIVKRSKRCT